MSSSSVPRSTREDQDEAKETPKIRYLSRREMLGLMGSTAITVTLAGCGGEQTGSSSSPSAPTAETTSASLPTPEGPGSVSGAPNLADGFTDTFTSRYIDTGDLRQHAVIGGEGPPLLLLHGWPENWYAWRLVMPELARDFEVIAVDQRGIGLSDKPHDGYDIGTLAADMVSLMDSLGHQRFALVGFDTGMFIAYALATDHPDRLDRLVVGEAFFLSITPPP